MYLSPKRVRQGSKVAIIAPASIFSTDELAAGLDVIRECGLKPILGPCVKNLRSSYSHAASLQDRVEEFHWAFSEPGVNAIICVRGGEGSAALLPYLNYDLIRKSQRAFLGKSDITSLCNGILKKAGLITFNGKTASMHLDKGESVLNDECESLKSTLHLLMSDQPWGQRPFKDNQEIPRTVNAGFATGIAIGGNCDTFSRLIGTEYLPDYQGSILFLEDVNKLGESLKRQFLHLRLSGILSSVAGTVLGEFFLEPSKKNQHASAIEESIIEYFLNGPPCSYGYSFSHGSKVCPIPIGANCKLNATSGIVDFDFCMAPAAF